MAKNTCECPNPPGGVAECEADQLAICRVTKGQIRMACVDAPMELRPSAMLGQTDRKRYVNWALAQITGRERSLTATLKPEHITMLQGGFYDDPDTGDRVTFRLPDSIAGDLGLLMPAEANQAAQAY
jgi:hypothetical protein